MSESQEEEFITLSGAKYAEQIRRNIDEAKRKAHARVAQNLADDQRQAERVDEANSQKPELLSEVEDTPHA